MNDQAMPPMPIKGLATPLLRPLPTIFTYATYADSDGHDGSAAARRMFTAHLRAFNVMLVALTRSAGLPDVAARPLLYRSDNLAGAGYWEMSGKLSGFKAELQLLHEEHGRLLKEAAREQIDRLRHLFQVETGPCRVVSLHNAQTWQLAETVCAQLVDGCWSFEVGGYQ